MRVKAFAADPNYSNVSVIVEPFSPTQDARAGRYGVDFAELPRPAQFSGLDITVFNQMVFEALKPGGIYFILDHATEPGAGTSETATLHRIDPETVKREVLAAGFVFVGSSNVLRQPGDPHTAKVFDPAIRGRTDQFILKFRKP